MAEQKSAVETPDSVLRYEVSRAELPVQCPRPGQALWNSHPRVYLPVGELGHARCPYCGAEYVLKD